MISAVLYEAFLYGAIAAIVALTSREFRTFNLVAGLWVVIGGWLADFVFGSAPVPAHPMWLLAVALVGAVVQILSPKILRDTLRSDPLRYLLIVLGISIAMHGALAALVLHDFSATLTRAPSHGVQLLYAALMLSAAVLVNACVFSSSSWAKAAMNFRVCGKLNGASPPSAAVSRLVALEIGLLLLLGAATPGIHRGLIEGRCR
ncbi:MAG: hypothetical protein QM783_05235 [Phycisphaerales bacterium]